MAKSSRGILYLLLAIFYTTVVIAQPVHSTGSGDSYRGLAIASFQSDRNYDVIVGLERGHSSKPVSLQQEHPSSQIIEMGNQSTALSGRLTGKEIRKIVHSYNISYIEKDAKVSIMSQNPSWGWQRLDADKAINSGYTGNGVHVAVIDTGIDGDHPDLNSNVGAGKAWVSCDPAATSNTCHHNWTDDNYHGTHVAGIVGAEDNNIGVVGVAPNVTLHALKVLDSSGRGSTSNVAEAIIYAADQNWSIAQLSLGGPRSSTLENAVEYATDKGTLVVAAAGNSGQCTDCVGYPAAYNESIAVAATNSSDMQATYSSQGPEVDIAAPGTAIRSTVPNGYSSLSGTSMATPFVSGTAALLKGRESSLTNTEVKDILYSTTEELGLSENEGGHGFMDIEAAVRKLGFYVTVESPSNISYSSSRILLNVSSTTALSKAYFSLDGDANQSLNNYTGYYQKFVNVSQGSHSVKFYLSSNGDTKTRSVTFRVDPNPPQISMKSPSNKSYQKSSIDINFTVTDFSEISSCTYSINSRKEETIRNCSNITNAKLPPGRNNLTLSFKDSVGNKASETVFFSINNITEWHDSFSSGTGLASIKGEAKISNSSVAFSPRETPVLIINEYSRDSNDSIEVVSTQENLNISGYSLNSSQISAGGTLGDRVLDAGEAYFKSESGSDFSSGAVVSQSETVKLYSPEGEVVDCLSIGTSGCNFTLETGSNTVLRNSSIDTDSAEDWAYSSSRSQGQINRGQSQREFRPIATGTIKSVPLNPENLELWKTFTSAQTDPVDYDIINPNTEDTVCESIENGSQIDSCLIDTDRIQLKATVNVSGTLNISKWGVTWKEDVEEPSISIERPSKTYWNTSSIPLNVSTSGDIYSWKYEYKGINHSFAPNTSLLGDEGYGNITVWAKYANNAFTSASRDLIIDLSRPDLTEITVSSKEYVSGTVEINGSAVDTVSAVNLSKFIISNGSILQKGRLNTSIDTTDYSNGEYQLSYIFTDKAGNTLTQEVDFWIDNRPPEIYTNLSSGENLSTASPVIGLNFSEEVSEKYSVDGGLNHSFSREISLNNLSEGNHSLEIWAEDRAGNSKRESLSFTIDLTEPSINISILSNTYRGRWYKDSANISVTCTDGFGNIENIEIAVSGEKYLVSSRKEDISFSRSGSNNYTISCIDYAGNRKSRALNISIDSKPPTPQGFSPANSTEISKDSITLEVDIAEGRESGLNISDSKVLFDSKPYSRSITWSNNSIKISVNNLKEGKHQISGKFYDRVNHSSTWLYSFSYQNQKKQTGSGGSSSTSSTGTSSTLAAPTRNTSAVTANTTDQVNNNSNNIGSPENIAITTEKSREINIQDNKISISSIKTEGDTYIEIRTVKNVNPAGTSKAYKSWNISSENSTDITINFTVKHSWLREQNATISEIILLHKQEKWRKENFTLFEQDKKIIVKAELEDFSLYTIGLEKRASCQNCSTEKTANIHKQSDKSIQTTYLIFALALGLLLAIISAVVYLRHQQSSLVEKTEDLKNEIEQMDQEETRIYRSNLEDVERLIRAGQESRAEERIQTLLSHAKNKQ